jgi:hypothetical protein
VIQDTSIAALETHSKKTKEIVFDVIKLHDEGIIAEDIEIYLGAPRSSVTARVRDLVLDNRVFNSGKRGTTSSGRSAIMWKAA